MGTLKPTSEGFINFYTNQPNKDQQVDDAVRLLTKKSRREVTVVKVKAKPANAETRAAIDDLLTDPLSGLDNTFFDENERSRLFLHGHGSAKNQTLGGWTAKEVFELLGSDWTVDRLRILGCRSARFKGGTDDTASDDQLENSVRSFAGTLCNLLKNPKMEIHANYYTQTIVESTISSTKHNDLLNGGHNPLFIRQQEAVVIGGRTFHGAKKNGIDYETLSESIIVFKWQNGRVVASWKGTGKYGR